MKEVNLGTIEGREVRIKPGNLIMNREGHLLLVTKLHTVERFFCEGLLWRQFEQINMSVHGVSSIVCDPNPLTLSWVDNPESRPNGMSWSDLIKMAKRG